MFVKDPNDRMILGGPFMKGYYITHDLDNLNFGIVPQNDSTKSKGIASAQPN